ncbi:Lrp/AsnC family transcriptional regulator, leucine-responsive regulatory protein [Geosporobacter subterraneus DSM 17957]|uniref:Lrp/AsnC family transcriptional regulator, leucine-responsive regulatory protein n=1 Tax=Geosporobacter subterraneus DSM 17957 TaxID=1121919 RepID=A0A1M6L9P1_9FIRM|nr:Lrp/AsnC family transcriptional regulator [Geosporobacter subterraneus]SHJ67921.1 Lrp/AsnC family transcriptional regulator, leucine-responsive regulatory protein [Geosporobacter subterraneus DSM 17957]
MDAIDKKILELLKERGRITHEEISKILHISRPAIHQRISKLEDRGIIRGYTAQIHWKDLGYQIKVLIFIKFHPHGFGRIAEQIMKIQIPNAIIEDFYRLAGEWCAVIKVRAHTPDDITVLIDEICKLQGIRETSTTFILSTLMENEDCYESKKGGI